MKTLITALTLSAATAIPAFADTPLTGTVISTMGDASIVALHERERAIGNDGFVQVNDGASARIDASRIYDARDAGKFDNETREVTQFKGGIDATNYGVR